jgi:hypothetical protein
LLPAVSVIPNVPAAVNVDTVAPPPAVADEVAVTVHTVDEVCAIPVKAEMFVKVKSVPDTVDKVEQVIFSLPVTVNVIVPEVEVDAERARVTVGAVKSCTSENIGYSLAVALLVDHVEADAFALSVFDCCHPLALPV